MQDTRTATPAGRNRTGQQTSPLSGEMNDIVQPVTAEAADASALTDVRLLYIREAEPLGDRPQAFLDKLSERLAYERGGTRLYDAVIAKFIAHAGELQDVSLKEVVHIREEEASHAALIRGCIEQLGGDPTVQTPSADLVGVATAGFLQAASDPRTTLEQTLQVALAAELVDVASWEMLIWMAEDMGQDGMVKRFRRALEHENEHVTKVRGWFESLVMANGAAAPKGRKKPN